MMLKKGPTAIRLAASRPTTHCRLHFCRRLPYPRALATATRPAVDHGLPLDVHPEVAQALNARTAVVALETAIVTHGLPHPASLTLPLTLERIVRDHGAVPAHIAIFNGRIKVGLELRELEALADPAAGQSQKWKVGRRDIAGALVKGVLGGTTVSGTMVLAHLAGIRTFVTGGIGGVHRGATQSMDISSDLTELGRTPVAVVCAGAKSILDIGLTLEFLETQGIPVACVGPTRDFPAFYTPQSGFYAPMKFETPSECAEMLHAQDMLNQRSGALFAVPIPSTPSLLAQGETIQAAVDRAVRESEEQGINKRGKEVTPWLLARVKELTQGASVESNIALIKNNAAIGSQIAFKYSELNRSSISTYQPQTPPTAPAPQGASPPVGRAPAGSSPANRDPRASVLVIGSAAIDLTSRPVSGSHSPLRTTVPGRVSLTAGGVSLNVATAVRKLGVEDVALVSPLGSGPLAALMKAEVSRAGLRTDALVQAEGSTAVCSILQDEDGELIGGVADMGIVESITGPQIAEQIEARAPKVVCFDGNLTPDAISSLLATCSRLQIPTVFEPTSDTKALRIFPFLSHLMASSPLSPPPISLLLPNVHELHALYSHLSSQNASSRTSPFATLDWFDPIDRLGIDPAFRGKLDRRVPEWVTDEGVLQMGVQLLPAAGALFVKAGGRGVVVLTRAVEGAAAAADDGWAVSSGGLAVKHYPALGLEPARAGVDGDGNVTGAGDSLCGAVVAGLARGWQLGDLTAVDRLVQLGQSAAVRTLASAEAVADLSDLQPLLARLEPEVEGCIAAA